MRLTNDIREKIKKALLDRGFRERESANQKRANELALRVYRTRMSEAFEAQLDAINEARHEHGFERPFVETICAVDVCVEKRLNYRLDLAHRRVWTDYFTPDIKIDPEQHAELLADIEQHVAIVTKLAEDKCRTAVEIEATLNSFTTAQKLRAGWPEVMPIVEPILEACGTTKPAQVPMVQVSALNDLLGLPPEEEEQVPGGELVDA